MLPTLAAALGYAARGWQVLPLHWPKASGCSCGRPKCPSHGKHPIFGRWEHYATTDEATLRDWWARCPEANVGIAVGASRLAVLDVDGAEGVVALLELEEEHHELPRTLRFKTGGGGFHLIFRDSGYSVPCRGHIRPKLDIRGEGGSSSLPPRGTGAVSATS